MQTSVDVYKSFFLCCRKKFDFRLFVEEFFQGLLLKYVTSKEAGSSSRLQFQNGGPEAIITERNVMEPSFRTICEVRSNAKHKEKGFHASAQLPSELDG